MFSGTITLKVVHERIFEEYVLKADERTNVTFISTLPQDPHPGYLSLLTDSRSEIHADITMVDVASAMNPHILTENLSPNDDDPEDMIVCRWCVGKIPVGCRPLGCPVDWLPSQIIRTSFSEMGRDDFTIKENVISAALPTAALGKKKESSEVDNRPAHYKTRHIFDSLNCVLAFAIDQREVPEYKFSIQLVHKLFRDLFPEANHELQAAPHWSLLKRHGGFLSKKKFDERIGVVIFVEHGNIELPIFKPYGTIVSTRLTFTSEASALR